MKPYRNALLAAAYIAGIVVVLDAVISRGPEGDSGRFLVLPMAMLSLLVLSVTVMAYLFGYEPVRLFVEGQRREAVLFFWKTVATFAGCAALFVAAYLVVVARG